MKSGQTGFVVSAVALVLLSAACRSNNAASDTPAQQTATAEVTPQPPGTEVPLTPGAADSASRIDTQPAQPVPAPAPARPAPGVSQNAPPAPVNSAPAPVPAAPAPEPAAPAAAPAPTPPPPPEPRLVSIPANTALPLALQTEVGSDISKVEDRVAARVTRDVLVGGEVVVPEGSRVAGRVTYAQPSGKVKGRAALTVRFYSLTIGDRTYEIATEPLRREAEGTKAKDARNIGIGAGAGAAIGAILGGKKGAGIGAAVGGAGGTGVVLATKGEEVHLPSGTTITTRLASPVTVDVR